MRCESRAMLISLFCLFVRLWQLTESADQSKMCSRCFMYTMLILNAVIIIVSSLAGLPGILFDEKVPPAVNCTSEVPTTPPVVPTTTVLPLLNVDFDN